jgi:hypothetical protein
LRTSPSPGQGQHAVEFGVKISTAAILKEGQYAIAIADLRPWD